jgi:predicted RNA-binding protein YlxR (DUF448 family)
MAGKRDKAEAGERRCIVSREALPRRRLIRFVLSPDNEIVPDIDESLPGRGFWVEARREPIETAARKNIFAKAAKQQVKVDPALADRLEAMARRRVLELLGLARKAGQVRSGFEKVKGRLAADDKKPGLLLIAGDSGRDGKAKLSRMGKGWVKLEGPSAAEMGAALGRDLVVHVAVEPGRLAEKLEAAARLLYGLAAGTDTGGGNEPAHPETL